MAKAGRPLAEHNRRFEHIPRRQGGLYLAEFGNGIVKVGQSGSMRKRLIALDRTCHRYGHSVLRFAAFPDCREREAACIAALSAKADAAPGHVEFFHGISFQDALLIVMTLLASKA